MLHQNEAAGRTFNNKQHRTVLSKWTEQINAILHMIHQNKNRVLNQYLQKLKMRNKWYWKGAFFTCFPFWPSDEIKATSSDNEENVKIISEDNFSGSFLSLGSKNFKKINRLNVYWRPQRTIDLNKEWPINLRR